MHRNIQEINTGNPSHETLRDRNPPEMYPQKHHRQAAAQKKRWKLFIYKENSRPAVNRQPGLRRRTRRAFCIWKYSRIICLNENLFFLICYVSFVILNCFWNFRVLYVRHHFPSVHFFLKTKYHLILRILRLYLRLILIFLKIFHFFIF